MTNLFCDSDAVVLCFNTGKTKEALAHMLKAGLSAATAGDMDSLMKIAIIVGALKAIILQGSGGFINKPEDIIDVQRKGGFGRSYAYR